MPTIPILTDKYHVRAYQVDTLGRMHPFALCGLFQEIAGQHAAKLGWGYHDMKAQNRAWMLSRLGMKVNRMPRWRENIQINTWVRETDRLFSHRDFEVVNDVGEQLVMASTAWLMLDTQSRRLMRVEMIRDDFVHFPEKAALGANVRKIPNLKDVDKGLLFEVQYSDLDMLGHTNNIRYIQWMFDQYSRKELEEQSLSSFAVNYLSEALWKDELFVNRQQLDGKHRHEIIRKADGKALCRGELVWKIKQ